jgi:hypothetical protein
MCMARGVAMMREAWLDMRVLRLYRSCKEHTLPVRHQQRSGHVIDGYSSMRYSSALIVVESVLVVVNKA